MDRALILLLWLRFRAWFRRTVRRMASVQGLILTALGLMIFAPSAFALLFDRSAPNPAGLAEGTRRFGPMILCAYCLLTLLFSPGDKAFAFSPAEISFLFPAPFSRRQLLAYKVGGNLFLAMLSSVFVVFAMRKTSPNLFCLYVGLVLAFWFLQLFAITVTLLGAAIGAAASTWRRRIAVGLILGLVGAAAASAGLEALKGLDLDTIKTLENAPAVRAALAPFRPFTNAMTSRGVWHGLLRWGGIALGIDACLFVLILALDARYLESVAVSSERFYARLERMKKGGPAIRASKPRKKPWKSVPDLPWWGGIGPILWKQLLTARRDIWKMLIPTLSCLSIAGLGVFLANYTPAGPDGGGFAIGFSIVLLSFSLMFSPLLNFDFRGDYERMEGLKTLPIPASRLALGQVAAPTVLATVPQVLCIVVLGVGAGPVPAWFWTLPAFALLVNALLMEVENVMFLWFPTKPLAATPGDIQAMGRAILMMLAKTLTVGVTGGLAALLGLAGYFVGGWIAALTLAWLVLVGFLVGFVPLMAAAFRGFDVASDIQG